MERVTERGDVERDRTPTRITVEETDEVGGELLRAADGKLLAKALASEYDAREQMVFAPIVEVLQRVIRALGRSGPR